MDIRDTSEVVACARRRLTDAGQAKRIAAIFAGLALGISTVAMLAGLLLDTQISQASGLSGMGRRTMLSSVQSMLPVISTLVILCLELGYQAAMLRVARGQYASAQTLRLGFARFWVLLRCLAVQGLLLAGMAFVGLYLSVAIFMFTPLSAPVTQLLTPLLQDVSMLTPQITLDDGLLIQLMDAMAPAFVIYFVLLALLVVPILFRFRMARYVIIDRPGMGAVAALRESRKMMRGRCLRMLKLDIRLWWYYAAGILATILCYGDVLLPLLGVDVPWMGGMTGYFLFYALYVAAQFAVYCFLRNPAEVSYAIAYDAIRPQESRTNEAVLGNIFRM